MLKKGLFFVSINNDKVFLCEFLAVCFHSLCGSSLSVNTEYIIDLISLHHVTAMLMGGLVKCLLTVSWEGPLLSLRAKSSPGRMDTTNSVC